MKIKIGHLDYHVRGMSALAADSESAVGMHVAETATLYVRADLPPAEQARVLLHEILHAVWHAHNLPDRVLAEEDICGALESPLATLVRDNPGLWLKLRAAFDGRPLVKREHR